jgi:hypothetical protein
MAFCAGAPVVGRLILVKITFIYLVLKKYFGAYVLDLPGDFVLRADGQRIFGNGMAGPFFCRIEERGNDT